MSEAANNAIFALFALSTALCMKRGGYAWVPAILTGLISPVVYLILFTVISLPVLLVVGALGIAESQLPSRVVEVIVSVGVVFAWAIGGFILTRRKSGAVSSPIDSKSEASN